MKQLNWIGVILSFALTIACSGAIDRTRTDRSTGSDVVQSVVDSIGQKCIFPNDRLFVRRMAYVETEDGTDGYTFRPGYFGGIWQIPKISYEATKKCGPKIRSYCDQIKKEFNIDWQKTTWKDLLKPLYSGLAAHLTLVLHGKTNVPGSPAQQETLWESVFHSKVFNHTRDFPGASKALTSKCNGKADLVFLLDESGSVGGGNFLKVKNFLEKTTQRLSVGPNNIRVSLVKFGGRTTVVYYLNQKQNHAEVVKVIKAMPYKGGSTPTDQGINTVTDDVFSTQRGAKATKDAPRILVLVTDGQSDNKARTLAAANKAKSHSIDIFSVGVGNNIDFDELRRVASKCNHVFSVENFDDFDNFIYELTKETCKAKAHVTIPENTGGNGTHSNGTIRIVEKVDGHIKRGIVVDPDLNGTEGRTIVIDSKCAIVKVYGSHDNENPSESMFQITGTSTDGRPVILYVKNDKDGKPLYLSFEATKLNGTARVCLNDSNFVVTISRGKPKVGEVICKENGVIRNCTSVDLIRSRWGEKICPRDSDISTIGGNPCTPERLRAKQLVFPYPNDNTKFIKCDLKGRVYVIICPEGLLYEPGRESCGTEVNLPQNKTRLVNANPCTRDTVLKGHMYFPYKDNNKYYIQCDQWGGAWLVPCPDEDIWSQKLLQCVRENAQVKSPCTPKAIDEGMFFFPYPGDKHKYIHCTGPTGSFVVQSCGKMVYDVNVHNCLPAYDR